MLLSLARPSPAAAAALLLLDTAAGEVEVVAVVEPGDETEIIVVDESPVPVVVPLAGESMRVTVKFAGVVDDAWVLGRDQVVVVEEQSVVAWTTWSGLLGLVLCAWARDVVAPRAARMW